MGFCCWQIGTCVYNGGLILFHRIKPSGEITVSSELYLKKLVSFNTTSSDNAERDRSNGELIKYMADHFAKCGFVTHYYEIAPNKFNLLALSPSLADGSDSLGLLLSGHSDCVPFDASKWTHNPLELTNVDNLLYGRGACDMKAFLACMMTLAANQDALKSKVSFLVTCDEESSMNGAIDVPRLFAQPLNGENFNNLCSLGPKSYDENFLVNKHFDLIIIGEPTLMQPVVAHKGYIARELTLHGISGHSSNPQLGVNSIHSANLAITKLLALSHELQYNYVDPDFAVNYPTLNLGYINGGHSLNSICDEVKLGFDIRPTPSISYELLVDKINKLYLDLNDLLNQIHASALSQASFKDKLNKKAQVYQGDNPKHPLCSMSIPFADIPAFCNKDLEPIKTLLTPYLPQDIAYDCVNYCTEASFLQKLGPTVVLGPGSIDQAHGIDEYVALSELTKCDDFLCKLITSFKPRT